MTTMTPSEAVSEIKSSWRSLYPQDRQGKGIVCPLCSNGSGSNGDGIREVPGAKAGILHCFKCGFTGDVLELYAKEHGLDTRQNFKDVVDALAGKLGIAVDWSKASRQRGSATPAGASPSPMQPTQPAEAQPQDYGDYIKACAARLLAAEGAPARAYLQGRGISLEIAQSASLGYDPAWVSPTSILKLQAQGRDWRPKPKPVLIIPTSVRHYVARDIRPKEQIPKVEHKYIKMNEGTPELYAMPALYNEGGEPVFVVEGAIDALSVMETGHLAVALHSTNNIEKLLLQQLGEHKTQSTLILCMDNDDAGRRATAQLRDELTRMNVSFITEDITGQYKDANEALCADREAFTAAVETAVQRTAARPDNTSLYMDTLMAGEIDRFRGCNIHTGFANLDAEAGALYPGLYVLAALTSLGKTTFALQMADAIASQGYDVVFVSLEMSKLELACKSLARITAQTNIRNSVGALEIRRGYLPKQVLDAVEQYKASVGERMNIIEGNFGLDTGAIRDYMMNYRHVTGATPVLFVDYLQVLQPAADESRGSKREEIDIAVLDLKRLSREMETPVIVISSLNRAGYLQPFSYESLKESGGIEYTADVIWGLEPACMAEPLFDGKENVAAKRKRITDAKAERPRKIALQALKNRYGRSDYRVEFDYYQDKDLFVPRDTAKGGRQ